MNSNSPIAHEEIAARAYKIWEQNGCPESHDTEFWFRAEHELQQERQHAGGQNISVGDSVAVLAAAKNGSSKNRRTQVLSRASAV